MVLCALWPVWCALRMLWSHQFNRLSFIASHQSITLLAPPGILALLLSPLPTPSRTLTDSFVRHRGDRISVRYEIYEISIESFLQAFFCFGASLFYCDPGHVQHLLHHLFSSRSASRIFSTNHNIFLYPPHGKVSSVTKNSTKKS